MSALEFKPICCLSPGIDRALINTLDYLCQELKIPLGFNHVFTNSSPDLAYNFPE